MSLYITAPVETKQRKKRELLVRSHCPAGKLLGGEKWLTDVVVPMAAMLLEPEKGS